MDIFFLNLILNVRIINYYKKFKNSDIKKIIDETYK
jgi:hypothetical protein